MMKFAQLICMGELHLEPKIKKKKKIAILISNFCSLRKVCLKDLYLNLHEY